MIKIKDNSKIFIKGLDKKIVKTTNTQPLMLKIAEDMKTKVDMRFRLSKDPNGNSWESLSESTISNRRKNSSKPLVDTGALRASINSKATKDTAIVGTNKEYAAMQNFGAEKEEFGTKLVDETVREHTRRRLGRTETVRQHRRTRRVASPWGNVPARRFIGFSSNQKRIYASMIKKFLKGEK